MKKVTKLNEYQRIAMSHLYYFGSKERQLEYAVLALCGEAGELANVLKKMVFYNNKSVTSIDMIDELSDVLWYVACVADALGIKLSSVASFNVNKIVAKQKKTDTEFKSLVDSFEKMKEGGFRWRIDGKKWKKQ